MDNEQNTPAAATPAVETPTATTTFLTGTESTPDANPAGGAKPEGEGEPAPKADEPTPEGDKAGKGDQGSIDTYAEFVVPEGMTINESLLNEAVPIFKELGLTQEQAQKLVDFQAKQQAQQLDTFNQQIKTWADQAKTDKEFGGDKFEENVALARSAVSKFGTPELKQMLNEYGVGNHPEIIRFMVKVGQLTREDVPGSKTATPNKPVDHVALLYPNDRNG